MRRLLLPLLAVLSLPQCRERTDNASVSAPSAIDAGDAAKTRIDGDAAQAVFRAFVGRAPLNKDTGDFFHFTKLSCQAASCTGSLAKADHEMLLASGDVGNQMKVDGTAAEQASQALASAGANPANVQELCCLTDGIKFACSFVTPTPVGSTATAQPASTAQPTATATATATATNTTTTTTQPTKKKPIVGSCYCGLHDGYCMIFKYGDENALGYRKSSSCTVPQCQQNFGTIMINECKRVWRVWPVQ